MTVKQKGQRLGGEIFRLGDEPACQMSEQGISHAAVLSAGDSLRELQHRVAGDLTKAAHSSDTALQHVDMAVQVPPHPATDDDSAWPFFAIAALRQIDKWDTFVP